MPRVPLLHPTPTPLPSHKCSAPFNGKLSQPTKQLLYATFQKFYSSSIFAPFPIGIDLNRKTHIGRGCSAMMSFGLVRFSGGKGSRLTRPVHVYMYVLTCFAILRCGTIDSKYDTSAISSIFNECVCVCVRRYAVRYCNFIEPLCISFDLKKKKRKTCVFVCVWRVHM